MLLIDSEVISSKHVEYINIYIYIWIYYTYLNMW